MKIRLLLASIMVYLACTNVAAQQTQTATVKSLTLTTDHIPSGDRRVDQSGNPCALVKVQVLDDIERVEGNKIGDIINRGVEKWIYMCKGSRNMKIHFKNHLPLRVTFRDYKINGLEGNRVYELVINASGHSVQDENITVKGNNLQMKVTPQNATVTIWGDNYQKKVFRAQNDGSLIVYLPYGRYHYSATAEGYNDLEGSVFVNDENKWENVQLSEVMGTLIVKCFTKDFELFINGQRYYSDGNSLWNGQLLPGEYLVRVRKKGYLSKSETVSIKANQTTTVNMERLLTKSEQKKIDAKKKKQEKMQQKSEENAAKLATKEAKRQKTREKKEESVKQKQKKQKATPVRITKPKNDTDEKPFAFGIRAGLNFASLGLDSDADGSCSMKVGFHLGGNVDIRLMSQLHLNASLLYSQKGYEYKSDYDSQIKETATAQFITLPVQLSYRIGIFQINAGPYLDYGLGGEIEYGNRGWKNDTFDYYDALNYGIIVGAGVNIGKNFFVGANYEMGLSDYANRNLAISLGYNF